MNARATQSGKREQVVEKRNDRVEDEDDEFGQNFGLEPDEKIAELVSNLVL